MILTIALSALVMAFAALWISTTQHDRLEDSHFDIAKRVKLLEQLSVIRQPTMTVGTSEMAKPARKPRTPRK